MTREDVLPVRINTHEPENWQTLNQRKICPLYDSQSEQTYLEKLIPHQSFAEHSANGIELLVIQGELLANGETYPAVHGFVYRFKAAITFMRVQREQSFM